MRKDVKFGITVGAILIATLTVYVIVLMVGSAPPNHANDAQMALKPAGDATPAPAGTDSSANSSTNTPAPGATNTPAPGSDSGATPSVTSDPASPTTNPSASSGSNADWNSMLNNGDNSKLADGQPQHTVTPSIDHPDVAIHPPQMTSTPQDHPALIDVPSLSASTPVDSNPSADPATRPTQFSSAAPIISDPSTPQRTERTHKIQSGESIWSIAESVYGNGKYYDKILKANPSVDPRHLKVGKTLVIPELGEAERSTPMARGAADTSSPLDAATEYRVASGDTLERISMKLYGDSRMVDKIYEANKSLIGADENKLTIGWILKLPTPPTAATAAR